MKRTAALLVALIMTTAVVSAQPAEALATKCDSWRNAYNSARVRSCPQFTWYKGNLYARQRVTLDVQSAAAGQETRYFTPGYLQYKPFSGSLWCGTGRVFAKQDNYWMRASKGHPVNHYTPWVKLWTKRHSGASVNGACAGGGNPHSGYLYFGYEFASDAGVSYHGVTRDSRVAFSY